MIEVEASRAATAARLEGAAFGGWITSDVPLPLAGPSGATPRLSLQVREGRPFRRWPGDLPLARLGAVPAIEGDVSPSSGTVWLRPTSAGRAPASRPRPRPWSGAAGAWSATTRSR